MKTMTEAMNKLTEGQDDPDGVAVVEHAETKKQVTIEWKGDLIRADDGGWTYLKMGTSEALIHGDDLAVYSNHEMKTCYQSMLDSAPNKISFFRQIVAGLSSHGLASVV